ncbi:MAG: aspartate-semialdehyde dehydrogenase [Chromatiales bacterium]
MSPVYEVAVVGATGAAGEALLERLSGSGLPLGGVHALCDGGQAGARVAFGGRRIAAEPMGDFNFAGTRIAFFCPGGGVTADLADRASEAGALVIDSAGLLLGDPDVPLVVPGVNPQALGALGRRGAVAVPDAAAAQLIEVLAPLDRSFGLARVEVVTLLAVGSAGRNGVEELAGQSAQLLNGRPIEPRVFSSQIAFNLIPAVGPLEADGFSRAESALVDQVLRVLGGAPVVNASFLAVPVFYGDAQVVHLETRDPVSPTDARELWTSAGIRVGNGEPAASLATPVTHAAREDALFVERVRQSAIGSRGLNLWVLSDGVRRGCAYNSVQIADILVKNYL